jgi:hypothetical protein
MGFRLKVKSDTVPIGTLGLSKRETEYLRKLTGKQDDQQALTLYLKFTGWKCKPDNELDRWQVNIRERVERLKQLSAIHWSH